MGHAAPARPGDASRSRRPRLGRADRPATRRSRPPRTNAPRAGRRRMRHARVPRAPVGAVDQDRGGQLQRPAGAGYVQHHDRQFLRRAALHQGLDRPHDGRDRPGQAPLRLHRGSRRRRGLAVGHLRQHRPAAGNRPHLRGLLRGRWPGPVHGHHRGPLRTRTLPRAGHVRRQDPAHPRGVAARNRRVVPRLRQGLPLLRQ